MKIEKNLRAFLLLLEKLEDWLMDEGTELGLIPDQYLSPFLLSHKFCRTVLYPKFLTQILFYFSIILFFQTLFHNSYSGLSS